MQRFKNVHFFLLFAVAALLSSVRTSNAYVVTGATGNVNTQTGERPIRQEISKMQKAGGPVWELYLLAVQRFQQINQHEQLSWYQVSGIHGFPEKQWDGVAGVDNRQQPGYAPHGAIMFGPWHRVYLAAYEQIIVENAIYIAAQYPKDQRGTYQEAAKNLRIPYWDWAAPGGAGMPGATTESIFVVNTPTGRKYMNNPLSSYRFHPVTGEFPASWGSISKDLKTVRTPDDNGVSQSSVINAILVSNADSFRDRVYSLFARQTEYAPFSNQGYPEALRKGNFENIENIHNQIHAIVGGSGGHMQYLPISAFDPLFFLHHANIDRIFAMWSAINPDSYVIPQKNDVGTYAQAPGTVEDINTPLTPFHANVNGQFHNGGTARSTKTFGYTYPEVVDWNVTPAQLKINVRTAVTALYQPASSLGVRKLSRFIRRADSRHDWFINFSVKRSNVVTLSVHFFLGAPPTETSKWGTASNLIASQQVLPDMTMSGVGVPALAQIPLSRSLLDAKKNGDLANTDVESVETYLKYNLQWRVQSSTTGEAVDEASLEDLKISVVDQLVQISQEVGEFPQYGEFIEHPELQWSN